MQRRPKPRWQPWRPLRHAGINLLPAHLALILLEFPSTYSARPHVPPTSRIALAGISQQPPRLRRKHHRRPILCLPYCLCPVSGGLVTSKGAFVVGSIRPSSRHLLRISRGHSDVKIRGARRGGRQYAMGNWRDSREWRRRLPPAPPSGPPPGRAESVGICGFLDGGDKRRDTFCASAGSTLPGTAFRPSATPRRA